ncbi:unnamed protein product [Rodentolepis nana]|uniref:Reverse transcriptase domain-containing protein n=1 Tax=Rodentolepis nana TaxID=102285 RepID=A0A0R3TY61_RODNA|nr:unnamed protein product [Rodentolepis nana]
MVNRRLTWFLETNNILWSEQAGFRPQRSTNVATFSQHIKDALDARNFLRLFSSTSNQHMTDREANSKIGKDWYFPQILVKSCTLFNVFINDLIIDIAELVQTVTGVECLLYADDLVLGYYMLTLCSHQMIWYYGIPGLLYADDLVLWYSAYFMQMILFYGIPPL